MHNQKLYSTTDPCRTQKLVGEPGLLIDLQSACKTSNADE